MADQLLLLVNVLTVLFSASIVVFGWWVYKRYRELSGGMWLPIAFVFMFSNRLVILADVTGSFSEYGAQLRYIGAACFFMFSGILLYSLWRMKNEGEELLRSDKQAMKTIIEFEERRNRKQKRGGKHG